MDLLLLAVALAVILAGAELFTNGIEWFGHRLNLAEGAVGSVLAAVATAMPETLIPVIAILGPAIFGGGSPNATEIGVGAILGAPFMLATLAMFVTGLAIVILARRGRRGTEMSINVRVLGRDVIFFVVAYGIAIATAFLPADLSAARWGIAALLVAIYAIYVRAHFSDPAEEGDASALSRLHLSRLARRAPAPLVDLDVFPHGREGGEAVEHPRLRIIVTQVLAALALIVIGAQVFVGAVENLSSAVGLDPRILALIIAPIATELPEKFNSVIWVRSGKDTLAMGNITGAMVFQSCLPTLLGILFTEWTFQAGSALAFASAGAAFVATFLIFGTMLRRGKLSAWSLLIGGPIYLAYVAAALLLPAGSAALH
ncbi:MAG: sodium:calcium antiporter [Chloroflexota bacterium]